MEAITNINHLRELSEVLEHLLDRFLQVSNETGTFPVVAYHRENCGYNDMYACVSKQERHNMKPSHLL